MNQVTITSPTHAMALAAYLGSAALGVVHLTDLAQATQLEAWIGPLGYLLWSVGLLAAGLAGFVLCGLLPWYIPRRADLTPVQRARTTYFGMLAEAPAALTLGAATGLYEASLIAAYGAGVMTTQILAVTVSAGGICRLLQLGYEIHRVRRASDPSG